MRRFSLACLIALAAAHAPAASAATTAVTLPVAGLEIRLSTPKGHTWKVFSRWTTTIAYDFLALDPPIPTAPSYKIEVENYSTNRCPGWVQSGSTRTSTRGTFPTASKLRQWHPVSGWLRANGRETSGLMCLAAPKGLELFIEIILPNADTMADPAGAVKAAVAKAAGDLEAIRKAFEAPTTVETRPLEDPRVSSDGTRGTRTIRLAKSGLEVTLPADGAFWRYDAGDMDELSRQVPRMPSLTARVLGLPATDCTAWLDSMATRLTNRATRLFEYAGVPAGYGQGAVLWPGDDAAGTPQDVAICYQAGANAMGVAMLSTPAASDATPFEPLLKSLAAAAQATVAAGTPKPRPIPPSGRLAATSPGGPLLLPGAGIEVVLPRVANQTWSVRGSAVRKSDGESFKDELSRWVRGQFVGGAMIQLGDLSLGCPESQAKLLSVSRGGGRLEMSGEAGAGLHATAVWGTIGSRQQVAVCAQDGSYDLVVTVWDAPKARVVMDEARARGVLAANRALIESVVTAWRGGPDPEARPTHDSRLVVSGLERARTVRLPRAGYDVEIPDDGLFWRWTKQEPKSDGTMPLDRLTLLLPIASMLTMHVEHSPGSTDCASVLRRGVAGAGGSVSTGVANMPPEYAREVGRIVESDGSHTLVLCHASAKHMVLVQLGDHWRIEDLGRFGPILSAIAKASDEAPTAGAAPPAGK